MNKLISHFSCQRATPCAQAPPHTRLSTARPHQQRLGVFAACVLASTVQAPQAPPTTLPSAMAGGIMEYNGGAIVAMTGKDCVGIATCVGVARVLTW